MKFASRPASMNNWLTIPALLIALFPSSNVLLAQQKTFILREISQTREASSISLGQQFQITSSHAIRANFKSKNLQPKNIVNKAELHTSVILHDEKEHTLELQQVSILEPDFAYYEDNGQSIRSLQFNEGIHFQGNVDHNQQTMTAISFFDNGMNGLMQVNSQLQYQLSSTFGDNDATMQLTLLSDLTIPALQCNTNDWDHFVGTADDLSERTKEACKRTKISIRADYELYKKFNKNTKEVYQYITSLFNQVNAIYRRENIQISISDITVNTVQDGFTHTSANLDLNFAKNNYKTFAGNIMLVLSGFANGGKATLGGVAYINALCLKTYAYAFANVEGKLGELPNYIYDLFLASHELGHVFGSRHTHACVWGPKKNQAIDNCAAPEGTCAKGPTPLKGSIMSYCHLAGNPGIDLMLGFGEEPGKLIRDNVNKSTCLTLYSPAALPLNTADIHVTANVECSNGSVSYYYFDNHTIDEKDDILLATINKMNQDIGNIYDGSLVIRAHTMHSFGSNKSQSFPVSYARNNVLVANRYWEIESDAILSNPIQVSLQGSAVDLADFKGRISDLTLQKLNPVLITTPGDANPDNRYVTVNSSNITQYKYGTVANDQWQFSLLSDGGFIFTLPIRKFGDIGLTYNSSLNTLNDNQSRQSQASTSEFSIQPDPVQGEWIEARYISNSEEPVNAKIEVLDLQGKTIVEEAENLFSGENSIRINAQGLVNGLYLMRVSHHDEISIQRFILER